MKRAYIFRILAGLAIGLPVALLVASLVIRQPLREIRASADEAMLLDMDELVHAAQCAYALTGEAPASVEDIAALLTERQLPFGYNPCTGHNVIMHAPMPGRTGSEAVRAINQRIANLTHLRPQLSRVDAAHIELCGEFEAPSKGQQSITIAFDAFVVLDTPVLTQPHAAGRVCHTIDVSLPYSAEELRDASRLATLDAVATATECAFTEGGLPDTLQEIGDIILDPGRGSDPRRCDVRNSHLAATTSPDITYRPLSDTSAELCADFETSGPPSAALRAHFDMEDLVHFHELTAVRTAAGRHCYVIKMEDDLEQSVEPRWNDPVRIESLPIELQAAARQDKRAIGDVFNLLRLARCAWLMDGKTPDSFANAVEATHMRSARAHRHRCDWVPEFFDNPDNAPVARYSRIDARHVRVCADFASEWPEPLRLNYSGRVIRGWPGNLLAFSRPVSPGETCYEADVAF